jgi:hypothetical protein
VEIIHILALSEFGCYEFANISTCRDEEGIQSTIKQEAAKIDFVFITFHLNDKNKSISINPFIINFTLTGEDAYAFIYTSAMF